MKNKLILRSILGLAIIVLALIAFDVPLHIRRYIWSKNTIPLTIEIQNDLCRDLNIDLENPICNNNRDVYALDFFPIILEEFQPGKTTYEDFEIIFGKYQIFSSLPGIQFDDYGNDYFSVRYDIAGDYKYFISVQFYSNGILRRITTHGRF